MHKLVRYALLLSVVTGVSVAFAGWGENGNGGGVPRPTSSRPVGALTSSR